MTTGTATRSDFNSERDILAPRAWGAFATVRVCGGSFPKRCGGRILRRAWSGKSLDDISGYIEAEKHLPGMPSAREAAAGVGLAAFQAKLLEKIEELTLHVIDLKSANDSLRRRVDGLEPA
jgi:hypothetical protein